MSRVIRICPGVGDRKCGAFLSSLDSDPHPTCTRCRGKICTMEMTCDICADWSVAQWEQFVKKRAYKDRKKPSRPSGSVPPALLTSPRAFSPSGVSRPGTSSCRGSRGGHRGHLVLGLERLPPLPLDLGPARGVGVFLNFRLVHSLFSFSFGSGRSGSCLLAADSPFPRRCLGCLSPFLTARSTT